MEDPIVISPDPGPALPAVKRRAPTGSRAARIAMGAGAALTAISVIAFIGFAGWPLISGQGLREFAVSLIIPLLISLMGIVPGLLLYFTGRQIVRHGPGYGSAAVAAALAAPWLAFAFWWLPRINVNFFPTGAACAGAGGLLLLWSGLIIRARRQARA